MRLLETYSDREKQIALNYQERMERINAETANEIAQRLLELEAEQDRIRYYVSLLDKREAEVLRLFYFEGYSWEETAKGFLLQWQFSMEKEAVLWYEPEPSGRRRFTFRKPILVPA